MASERGAIAIGWEAAAAAVGESASGGMLEWLGRAPLASDNADDGLDGRIGWNNGVPVGEAGCGNGARGRTVPDIGTAGCRAAILGIAAPSGGCHPGGGIAVGSMLGPRVRCRGFCCLRGWIADGPSEELEDVLDLGDDGGVKPVATGGV